MRAEIQGVAIEFKEMGRGRPVVLFSGWGLDGQFMAHHYEPIFEGRAGWRRIYPDMPGMGRTPGADWMISQDDMLAVALDFLDAAAPGQRPVVIGASWGAYIALAIAHQRPAQLDGLMLIVPAIHGDRTLRDLPRHEVLVSEAGIIDKLVPGEEGWPEIAVVQTSEMLDAYRASIAPALEVADLAFLERIERRYAFSFPAHELPEPVTAPALIVCGRQDSICGYRDAWRLLEQLPRASYAVLDRAGHGLEDEQRSLFRALTGEWLDRVAEYASGGRTRRAPSIRQGPR